MSDTEKPEQNAEERRYAQYLNDLRWLMKDTKGRRIVWELMSKGKVFQTTFRPNSEMQFLEGKRSLALEVMNDVLGADLFEQWMLMHKEAIKREEEDNGSTDSNSGTSQF